MKPLIPLSVQRDLFDKYWWKLLRAAAESAKRLRKSQQPFRPGRFRVGDTVEIRMPERLKK